MSEAKNSRAQARSGAGIWLDQHLYSFVSSLGRAVRRPWATLLTIQFTWQAKKAQIDPMVVFWITLSCYALLRHVLQGPSFRLWALGWAAAGLPARPGGS